MARNFDPGEAAAVRILAGVWGDVSPERRQCIARIFWYRTHGRERLTYVELVAARYKRLLAARKG